VVSSCSGSIQISPLARSLNKGFSEVPADIIVHPCNIDRTVNEMLSRLKKIERKLLCICKESLPAPTQSDALQTMRKSLSREGVHLSEDSGLVQMNMSQSGVATIELNDPEHFNGISKELMSDLFRCIQKVNALSTEGRVKALVLCGKGTHFCTGAIVNDTNDKRAGQGQYPQVVTEVVLAIRKLPIPTLAVIHGKVIGGGLALSLAADWRICTSETTFYFGNLPNGRNPVMNLSLALPLSVGRAFANQMYLEDKVYNAESAEQFGLVNRVEATKRDAEKVAKQLAESRELSAYFDHGLVTLQCSESISHNALENELSCRLKTTKTTTKRRTGKVIRNMQPIVAKTTASGKKWTMEEIQLEVTMVVREVVSLDQNESTDSHKSLMDMGLDSLGNAELSSMLQSRFNVEFPSTFVFNTSTIVDISSHLYKLLAPQPESKDWTMEEIQLEVTIVVREVVSLDQNESIDSHKSLMDMGLDSLGSAELSSMLQSRFNVELPSTFVFNTSTIVDISSHLYKLLAPQSGSSDVARNATRPGDIDSSLAKDLSVEQLTTVKTGRANFTRPVLILSSNHKDPDIPKKPKVLFFGGAHTNERQAAYALKVKGYDKYFDFVIPAATYEADRCPDIYHEMFCFDFFVKSGQYSPDDSYWFWGAGGFELRDEDPSRIPQYFKSEFQKDLMSYIAELDKKFGPFDGVMGKCEGGAALHTVLGMKEHDKLNGILDSVKFFIHSTPWISPLGGTYATASKNIPMLAVYGRNDQDYFKPSADYREGFVGYYDEYSHDGGHEYAPMTDSLKQKMLSLFETDRTAISNPH